MTSPFRRGRALGAASALWLAAAGWLLAAPPARAEAWPTQPIHVVIPSAPGGLSDPVVRLLGEQLQRDYGQPVIMDFHAGAGGIVGTQFVAKARPDGYTLVLGNLGPMVFAPALTKVPYVPQRDLVSVGSLITFGNAVLVNPSLKIYTVADLIAAAKARPGTINFASAGNGQSQHLTGELFKRVAGVDIVHVAYKGTGPAMTDLIGGQVQIMFGNIPAALPFIASGQLRAIAVTGAKRSAALPDVPTVVESGLPGFVVVSWVGMFAPAGTPPEVVDKLNQSMDRAWASPEGQKLLATLNFDWAPTTPAQMSAFLDAETTRWSKLIKDAGIKGE